MSRNGFNLVPKGSFAGTGPFDAEATLVEAVTVTWQGSDIVQIALPPVCATVSNGMPGYETSARLTITDSGGSADFGRALSNRA